MYRDIHEHTKTKSDAVMRRSSRYERSGGNDGEVTPVPIPNTEVKLSVSMVLGPQGPGRVDRRQVKN